MVYFRKEFLNKIADEYLKGRSRDELSQKYDILLKDLTQSLKRRGIKLWDNKRRKDLDKICQLYKSKKLNRKQLVKKFNLTRCSLYNALVSRNIKLWDVNQTNNNKSTGRFYSFKKDKSRYAKLFYEFNK